MGVWDKKRLLSLGLAPAGLEFKSDSLGRTYLPFRNTPYELEDIAVKWVIGLSPEAADEVLSEGRNGLTEEGWDAFIRWMTQTLDDALLAQARANETP